VNQASALRANGAIRRRKITQQRADRDGKLRVCQLAAERGMTIPYPEVWEEHVRKRCPDGLPVGQMMLLYEANARMHGLSKGL
jgi:hypothetical protein